MDYDINRIKFVKAKKTKYFIQTNEHIFQICIDCIIHIHLYIFFIYIACIFKSYFFNMIKHDLWNVLSAVASCLLSSSAFVNPHTYVLTSKFNWFLLLETQLNMKLQMNYLQKDT